MPSGGTAPKPTHGGKPNEFKNFNDRHGGDGKGENVKAQKGYSQPKDETGTGRS